MVRVVILVSAPARGHTNPVMTYQSRDMVAAGTRLGAFAVPDQMLRGFGEPRRVAATEVQANALQIRVSKPVAINDGVLYVGRDPSQPAIGDMRVSFAEVPCRRPAWSPLRPVPASSPSLPRPARPSN